MKKHGNSLAKIEFLQRSSANLRGKQSVRATFKLTERSITVLSVLAGQLGIKQKSLFDSVMDDDEGLKMIARRFENFSESTRRVAKTYVISRKTLDNLEQVASRYNTPRDALVEFSIERLLPLLEEERKRHEKRKIFLDELKQYAEAGAGMLERAEKELGADDPVFHEMLKMLRHVGGCCETVEHHVKKGSRIENF
ncbi:hypothetical protein [Desulfomarina sp.]